MIYFETKLEELPSDCTSCPFCPFSKCRLTDIDVFKDITLETRNENCPLKAGSVVNWYDVRDHLPVFNGPVLVTQMDRKFNQDPAPEVKAATYKTKYRQFFRVTGNVIAWMPYPEVYRR